MGRNGFERSCCRQVKARTEPHQVSAIALALTPSAYCMTDGGSIASGHLRSIRVSITSVRPAPFLVYASLLTHPGESAMSRFVPLVCFLLCLPAAGALHAAPVNPLNRDPHSASPLTPPSVAPSIGPCSASNQRVCDDDFRSCNATCLAGTACGDRCCNQFTSCLRLRQCASSINCFNPPSLGVSPSVPAPP